LQVPGFVDVAPLHMCFVEFGQVGKPPWQHGSPVEPQHTPLRQCLLGQPLQLTHVSLAVLQSYVPPVWALH
jgi:hypothetical protein